MREEIKFETKADLAKHLAEVGPLDLEDGGQLFYREDTCGSPFRFRCKQDSNHDTPMAGLWDTGQGLYVVDPLIARLESEPVLCYVSDTDPDTRTIAVLVTGVSVGRYLDLVGRLWVYAKPVPDYKVIKL